ncbi:CRISPR-associated protein Csx17 [Prosthecobacter fusiformis]|uniref:CRISPR-associated protein Csx17 n=1 Tax=Prosthecobacter fusiformis TaxID=48464 RepID=A0A4R7RQS5_9BACT|nr:type I-U CRISPR-associated protein Csx17 [Prosthecobacter fusiformis]TDU67135.1 CRISPR-associated protein Csx17 [Prosthecobacter fusiformis]
MPTLTLSGCAPVPLAHYLKALGILRLVGESPKGDLSASAAWNNDQIILTSRFDGKGLLNFFLHDYQPTPVLAPWNGGSGFFKKDNREAIDAIMASGAARLLNYQNSLTAARQAVNQLDLKEKPDGEAKASLLQICRNTLPDDALGWLDAVFVLSQDGPKFPPLLGTGGNDGRLEFTNNFMQRITELMDCATGQPSPHSERWLRAALFGAAASGSTAKAPIGQFFPGAAGGANATSGFDAASAVNPWDFVLMIEGALLFAAASVKRLESSGDGSLIYPFCVRQTGVGYASASMADEKDARCEMWMPLWERATSLPELRAIFSEGRAQVGGRAAKNGVDFARAAVSLGVDRGISAFQRYGFQVRNGLAYFATPLDRVRVRRNAHSDILSDLDAWHSRLRSKADDAPATVLRGLNEIERRVFEFCQDDSPHARVALLVAAGRTQRALARSFAWVAESFIPPLSGLRPEWLIDNPTTEFRLAASLASTNAWLGRGDGKGTFWLRSQLEPVDIKTGENRVWLSWLKNPSNDVTWHDGDLTDCLNSIMARRIHRVEKAGCEGWPDWSPCYARLDDITDFIEGRIDPAMLADLIWGLSLIDWQTVAYAKKQGREQEQDERITYDWRDDEEYRHRAIPSSFYALLKLCFRHNNDGIPIEATLHQLARIGNGQAASRLAARRLRASGEAPLVTDLPVAATTARRTAAAMLFPISPSDMKLLKLTLQHQTQEQTA